jgi:transcriptional regulator with XRE-family HTH domain
MAQALDPKWLSLKNDMRALSARGLSVLKANERHAEGISRRLAEARSRLGMTQDQVSRRIGIGLRTYLRSESGERIMSASEIAAVGDLGVDTEWLLTGNGEMIRRGMGEEPARTTTALAVENRPISTTRHLAPEEVEEIYRRVKATWDEAVRLGGGWEPPRRTESAILTLLFGLALRNDAFARPGDIVELLGFLRQDVEGQKST